MSDLFSFIACVALWVSWGYAIITDISNNMALWAVIDFCMPPIGMIRGLILFFN